MTDDAAHLDALFTAELASLCRITSQGTRLWAQFGWAPPFKLSSVEDAFQHETGVVFRFERRDGEQLRVGQPQRRKQVFLRTRTD